MHILYHTVNKKVFLWKYPSEELYLYINPGKCQGCFSQGSGAPSLFLDIFFLIQMKKDFPF